MLKERPIQRAAKRLDTYSRSHNVGLSFGGRKEMNIIRLKHLLDLQVDCLMQIKKAVCVRPIVGSLRF